MHSRSFAAFGGARSASHASRFPCAATRRCRPPRPAQPPLQAAARAYIEGRYDGGRDTHRQAGRARSGRRRAEGARADRARTVSADAETLLRPVANRAPTSEAALELGLLQQMLGRPDATAIPRRRWRRSADTATIRRRAGARRARAPRARAASSEANAAYRDAAAAAPADAGDQHRSGASCSSRSTHQAEAMKSFQPALQARSDVDAGAPRRRPQRWPTTTRRRRSRSRSARSTSIRHSVDAHVFIAQQAIDAGHHDEARAVACRRRSP